MLVYYYARPRNLKYVGRLGTVHSLHESPSGATAVMKYSCARAFCASHPWPLRSRTDVVVSRHPVVSRHLANSHRPAVNGRVEVGHLLDPAEERGHACVHAGPVGHCAQTQCAMIKAIHTSH